MEQYAERAIEIINELHTERLDYESEYVPLIDAAHTLKKYEDIGTVEEFAALVQAESEGRLVELPCKEGTMVYCIAVDDDCIEAFHITPKIEEFKFEAWMTNMVGKSVFLTREAAEAALAEMGERE